VLCGGSAFRLTAAVSFAEPNDVIVERVVLGYSKCLAPRILGGLWELIGWQPLAPRLLQLLHVTLKLRHPVGEFGGHVRSSSAGESHERIHAAPVMRVAR
jgi:hypothetical protein